MPTKLSGTKFTLSDDFAVTRSTISVGSPVSVKAYGAKGDGVTDDTAAIQAAENAAASSGQDVELMFPAGTYAITASIAKASNVHWRGPGRIKRLDNAAPTGTQWALVYANQASDWSIEGVTFEAIAHDTVVSTSLPRANGGGPHAGGWNSCVDAYKCSRWTVRNCVFRKFSQGVKYTGSTEFLIESNSFYGETSRTVADMLAGTAQSFSRSGTAAISAMYDENGPVTTAGSYRVAHNFIYAPGLDIGIEMLLNAYTRQPAVCIGNMVAGVWCGIMAYNGSQTDPGIGETYNAAQIIANNHITNTWEQGIYIRGVLGVQVLGNYIERAALTNSDSDASAGSIVVRVNPFDSAVAVTYTSAAGGDVSDDHAIVIADNRCVDQGREGASSAAVIYVRVNNVKVRNNHIVRSAENFSTASFPAILVSNGGRLANFDVQGNSVIGPFARGVLVADVVRTTSMTTHRGVIENNDLALTGATYGIEVAWYAFAVRVARNRLSGCATGVRLRYAPYSSVLDNVFHGCTTSILLSEGNLASDYPYLVTGGSVTRAVRRGGTIDVAGNRHWGCTTKYSVDATASPDALFEGRAARWEREEHDGRHHEPLEYSGGTPGSSNTSRTWHKHARTYNSAAASGQPAGRVCVTPGTYGAATASTGNTTEASAVISAVSSLDGYGPGMYITATGFSGNVQILSVDTANSTITVSANAVSTNSGVSLDLGAPAFAATANLA